VAQWGSVGGRRIHVKLAPAEFVRFWQVPPEDFSMKANIFCAVGLVFSTQAALAANVSGNGALSLAALVGLQSPSLSKAEKLVLKKYLDSHAQVIFPKGKNIEVKAEAVTCRISNVDITEHSCDLTFGAKKKPLSGRLAHEIYATLVENGVPSDGAAGSIYEGITKFDCKITPSEVAEKAGGGVSCEFAPPK
jgi:hypothetical protein